MDKLSCSVGVYKEWHKIPILQTKGYRSLGGNWKELCLNHIKVKNPFCVWKFTSLIYLPSFNMNSSDIYKEGFSRIPSEQFSSGKRDRLDNRKRYIKISSMKLFMK